MARRKPSHIHRALTSVLPRRRIRELSRRLGVVRRRRKVDIVSLVYGLHNALEHSYPSVFTHYMKASAKLGVVMNVVGRGAKTIAITHGSRHDKHLLQAGAWMRGRLLLFDLGFYRASLFEQIDAHGGYFLTRMKKQGNPVLVRSHLRAHRHLVGMKLRDVQQIVDTDVIDVDAKMV